MNGASARLTRLLRENLLPFWESRAVDAHHGGYLLGHDGRGRYRRGADKFLVAQARTLWFFSRLLRSAYGTAAHRAAADHGLAFLRDRFWDHDAGGFVWSVDETGMHVTQDGKHLYGQAFALFALSEYVRNGGDRGAMQLGAELFALLESKAHDHVHGGYRQSFARDWTAATQARDYLGQPAPAKTLNTHLHLLEALLSWFVVDPEPRVRERIVELRSLLRERCAMPLGGDSSRAWGVELHNGDWSLAAADQPASYGHDVELAWLLLEADERLGETTWSSLPISKALFAHALDFGYDLRDGGFYASGTPGRPADKTDKLWWVQAEGLLGAARLEHASGEIAYRRCFDQMLGWIWDHQADWKNGEWHEVVDARRRPRGDKAGPWKGPYHNGRALLECLASCANAGGS